MRATRARRSAGAFIGAVMAATLLVQVAGLAPASAAPITFTVNNTGDVGDAAAGDGICNTGAGVCTLRAAIQEANAHAGRDTIQFIMASGVQTFSPATAYPALTQAAVVNGTTQPGYVGAPWSCSAEPGPAASRPGCGCRPATRSFADSMSPVRQHQLRINGVGVDGPGQLRRDRHHRHLPPGRHPGMVVTGSGHTIGGTGAGDANVVAGQLNGPGSLLSADSTTVQGQLHRDQPRAARSSPTRRSGSPSLGDLNVIGGTTAGARNVISGNNDNGIRISAGAAGTHVQGNYIGLSPSGLDPRGNFFPGIEIVRSGHHRSAARRPAPATPSPANGLSNIAVSGRRGDVACRSSATTSARTRRAPPPRLASSRAVTTSACPAPAAS